MAGDLQTYNKINKQQGSQHVVWSWIFVLRYFIVHLHTLQPLLLIQLIQTKGRDTIKYCNTNCVVGVVVQGATALWWLLWYDEKTIWWHGSDSTCSWCILQLIQQPAVSLMHIFLVFFGNVCSKIKLA